jgi:ABC-type lipoprotein export system ATPase subunit
VGRAEAALTEAQDRHDRGARLDAVLVRAAQTLRSAANEKRNTLREQMRVELRELLADVNDEPALQVEIDADMRVHIKPRHLHSYGLDDQSTVLKRVALSRNLTRVGVIPIFLDDVTSRMDEDRAKNLLHALRYLARARQVVVFAHDPTTRDWALRAAEQDGQISVLETTGVDQPVRALTSSHGVTVAT